MSELAGAHHWAGIMTARPPGRGGEIDIQDIEALGFQVLSVEAYAGFSQVYVIGLNEAVFSVIDTDFRFRIPSNFIKLSTGTPLTLETVKRWGPLESVVY